MFYLDKLNDPWWVIFLYDIICSLLFSYSILLLIATILSNRIDRRFQEKEATSSLIGSAKFCRAVYTPCSWIFRKSVGMKKDSLSFMIAIAAFAMEDYSRFLENIQKMRFYAPFKSLWLAFYHLAVRHDLEEGKRHYDAVMEARSEISLETIYFLQAVFFYENGEREKAYPLFKEIALCAHNAAGDQILNRYLAAYEENS